MDRPSPVGVSLQLRLVAGLDDGLTPGEFDGLFAELDG
jgi:hypothetical protein